MVTSRGFLTRKVAVIPHARTQSVEVSQGPWQRRLGLASVQVDSTPGPVTVVALHREAGQARAIAEAQLVRAAAARGRAPHERWMSGPRATPAASEAAAGPPGEESGHPGQLP
jgi:putative membrane protein